MTRATDLRIGQLVALLAGWPGAPSGDHYGVVQRIGRRWVHVQTETGRRVAIDPLLLFALY